jgi:hypothetical protein
MKQKTQLFQVILFLKMLAQPQFAQQAAQYSLPPGVDLTALLQQTSYNQSFAPTAQTQASQVLLSQTGKPKKKTPTAEEKREALVLNVLQGKDKYGFDYCNLLVQMTLDELQQFAAAVKAKHNLA